MKSNFEIKIICIVSGTMQTHPDDMKVLVEGMKFAIALTKTKVKYNVDRAWLDNERQNVMCG